jgi:outer membrane protein OmpA-like peptidoglycan-associated protein
MKGNYYVDYSTPTPVKVNRLQAATGATDTWALGAAIDVLYHFTPWTRVDPYLAAGYGLLKYGEEFGENDGLDATPRFGGGLLYHFNDSLALRADFRYFLSGSWQKSYSNSKLELGACWTIGAGTPARFQAPGGGLDKSLAVPVIPIVPVAPAPPKNPDSDRDGLTDADETAIHHTDPSNADTDWDGLSDGDEITKHRTNPLVRDTDAGGVADGHEAIEDHTDPLKKVDDLKIYELHIEFADNSAEITAQYYGELDVIGMELRDQPEATARIEGHIDMRKENPSSQKNDLRLTQKRATAVLDYLVKKWKIRRARMEAVGYGSARPREKPDLENGNLANRRIEIYIKAPPAPAKPAGK